VEVYRSHRDRIDLVLLDVQMSPWDGPRTLAELRRINPNVRVAFMSGSTDVYSAGELLALGPVRVFPKPFPSVVRLADELRALVAAG
jgi:two-component system, OmpR family, response regulator